MIPLQHEQIKIAVCGHIDHGKSTLIGRLLLDTGSLHSDKIKDLKRIAKDLGEETQLAYLTDQLKEERERNITIETTQIFLKTKKRPYCLIDTPGHLEFIKNMLSGASQADAALLVVDITEGIKDQTRRHAHLLHFLSIKDIIIIVNKMDLVKYAKDPFQDIEYHLRELFRGLGVSPREVIPISAKLGVNITKRNKIIDWYNGPSVIGAFDGLPYPSDEKTTPKALRLPVQDIYTIDGETVIVGRIAAGTIKKGQLITILPKNIPAEVRAVKSFRGHKTSATIHENVGLTLTTAFKELHRGNIICAKENPPLCVKEFRGNLVWLDQSPLKPGQHLSMCCSTQRLQVIVKKIFQRIDPINLQMIEGTIPQLEQNQAAIADFRLTSQGVIEKHNEVPEMGRYTIENDNRVLGIGTVLTHNE